MATVSVAVWQPLAVYQPNDKSTMLIPSHFHRDAFHSCLCVHLCEFPVRLRAKICLLQIKIEPHNQKKKEKKNAKWRCGMEIKQECGFLFHIGTEDRFWLCGAKHISVPAIGRVETENLEVGEDLACHVSQCVSVKWSVASYIVNCVTSDPEDCRQIGRSLYFHCKRRLQSIWSALFLLQRNNVEEMWRRRRSTTIKRNCELNVQLPSALWSFIVSSACFRRWCCRASPSSLVSTIYSDR